MIATIHSTYLFVLAIGFFVLMVAQIIKEGILASRRGESGWRVAGREARGPRVAVGVAFGLITLAKALLP